MPLLLKPVILQLIETVFNQGASAFPTIVRNGFFRRAAADPDGRAQMGESDAACDVTNWFNNASAARGFQFALNNATRRELHVLQFVFSSSLTTKATLWTTLACKENERKKSRQITEIGSIPSRAPSSAVWSSSQMRSLAGCRPEGERSSALYAVIALYNAA